MHHFVRISLFQKMLKILITTRESSLLSRVQLLMLLQCLRVPESFRAPRALVLLHPVVNEHVRLEGVF